MAKARDELRLAQVLDEESPYLRLALQRRKASPALLQNRLRGELSSAQADEHSRVAKTDP